jgi:hypothetical protein
MAAWLALTVLVFAWPDLSITVRGVPGSYPVVTALFSRRRWVSAACLLGLLVAARTTIVAIVPFF